MSGEDHGTTQIRIYKDLGEMLSWIVKVQGGTAASLLDPMLRPQITARYEKIKSDVEKIKKAEDAAARLLDAAAAKARGD